MCNYIHSVGGSKYRLRCTQLYNILNCNKIEISDFIHFQEELNQTESQEMLDVELGQYHSAGDCGNQVNQKNTPENQTRYLYNLYVKVH